MGCRDSRLPGFEAAIRDRRRTVADCWSRDIAQRPDYLEETRKEHHSRRERGPPLISVAMALVKTRAEVLGASDDVVWGCRLEGG